MDEKLSSEGRASLEDIAESLSDVRIEILDALERRDAATSNKLAQILVEGESRYKDVRRTEKTLHHTHLPILDDLGVLDYDHKSRVAWYDPDKAAEQALQVYKLDY